MKHYAPPLEKLIEQFERLPGVGHKSAQRLAFHVLSMNKADAEAFAQAILDAKKQMHTCPECQNLTDRELCPICDDDMRDESVICVVEDPRAVIAIEKMHGYRGLYHVLHGALSPMRHIGPDQIKIKELMARIEEGNVGEVILATNSTVEGEATAMYLSRLLRPVLGRIFPTYSTSPKILPTAKYLSWKRTIVAQKTLSKKRICLSKTTAND